MRYFLVILSISLFSSFARAEIFIDPYYGYIALGSSSQSNSDNVTPSANEFEHNGSTKGFRFGYQMEGFMGGIEYSHSMYDLKLVRLGVDTAKRADIDEFVSSHFGLFVGYELDMDFLPRAWFSYYFKNSYEDRDGDDKFNTFAGSGWVFGAGFNPIYDFNLNLEYRSLTLSEFTDAGDQIARLLDEDEIGRTEIILTVSMPIILD